MALTNLTFADDVLLFCRGDLKSVEMMLETVQNLFISTSMVVNRSKCKIYFGGIDNDTKKMLKEVTTFEE